MSTRHGSTKDSAAVLAVSSSLREKGYDQCLRRNFNKRRADRNKNRIVNCILVLKYLSLFYVSFYSGRAIAVLKRAIFAPDIHSSVRGDRFPLKKDFRESSSPRVIRCRAAPSLGPRFGFIWILCDSYPDVLTI